MILFLDILQRTVASRPFWIWLVLLLAWTARRRYRRRAAGDEDHSPWIRVIVVGAILYYVVLVLWYVVIPQQFDYAEPTMTAVSWLFAVGKPIYHSVSSAERYSHMYGPMAFVIPGAALAALGPSMVVGKAVGVAAALAALLLTWLALRSAGAGRWLTTVGCGLCVLEFLMFRNLTFWSRPEPLQLLCVATGLFAAAVLPAQAAAPVAALAMGILWNLKITGPLYSLPVLALLYSRCGFSATLLASAGAVVVAVLPFIVFENVSWRHYALWVRLSARNGLRVAAFRENLEWAVFFLLPVLARLAVPSPLSRAMRFTLPALLIGVCGVLVAASKPGAGFFHLAPFLPTLAYVYVATMRDAPQTRTWWLPPFAATLVFVAAVQQQYFLRILIDPQVTDSYADVREYIDGHPGERIAVGYASAERMTFARTLAVFATDEYLLDVPAIQEHQLSGVAVPASTTEAVRSCVVTTWLIPTTGEAFRTQNGYPSTGYAEVFQPDFIAAFHETYRQEGRTRQYDIWRCRTPGQ